MQLREGNNMMNTKDYVVRLEDLKRPIEKNPYNPNTGNIAAYMRYLRYNTPPADPNITYIIMETLAEFGIYGEEATIALIKVLKRIGRDDLIPPCAR